MKLWLVALALSSTDAATIRGIVLDRYTGRPLARTLVTLEAIEARGVTRQSTRANTTGAFAFPPVNAGIYLLSASRPGFMTLKYGQKAWNAPATPFQVEQDGSVFLELRLWRLGAITGTVSDENDIGLPDQEVVVYRNTRPPKLVGRSRTDERGMYRLGGLEPGQYLVRTVAKQLEDGSGLLPTFHKEVRTVAEARVVQVDLEEQVTDVNIRPLFGRLYRLTGRALAAVSIPISVALISDLGRVTTGTGASGGFRFEQLAPGDYELVAEGVTPQSRLGAYRRMAIANDVDGLTVDLAPFPTLRSQFEEVEGGRLDEKKISLFARRKDLAGEGAPQAIPYDRATLLPGRWEILIAPPPEYYTASITGSVLRGRRASPAHGWNEILLEAWSPELLRAGLSSRPAALEGRVLRGVNEPVAGAPVYLEAFDPRARRRLMDLRAARTGLRGEYRFAGLAPGSYRLLSSFEFEDPDEASMEAAGAKLVSLKEGNQTQQDLELHVRP